MPAPIGFTPERWQRIVDAAGALPDHWAAQATGCRWSDLDVFVCAPDRPEARVGVGLGMCMGRRSRPAMTANLPAVFAVADPERRSRIREARPAGRVLLGPDHPVTEALAASVADPAALATALAELDALAAIP